MGGGGFFRAGEVHSMFKWHNLADFFNWGGGGRGGIYCVVDFCWGRGA